MVDISWYIELVHGVYKPTNITGGHNLVGVNVFLWAIFGDKIRDRCIFLGHFTQPKNKTEQASQVVDGAATVWSLPV